MAAGNVTMTTAAAQIPEGWADDLILAARFQMIMPKLIDTHWNWEKNMGDTLHIRRMPNWDTAIKVHGADAAATTFTDPGDEVIQINCFEVSLSIVEDVAALFLSENYMAEMKKGQAYGLTRALEVRLTNLFQSLSQTATGAMLGNELNWETLLNAIILLQAAGIEPDTEKVHLVIGPHAAAGLKKIDLFVNSLTAGSNGPTNLERSQLGQSRVLGASVNQSNLLRAPAAGQHDCAIFDQRCWALMFAQKPKTFTEFRGLTMGNLYGVWQAYGFREINRYSETPGNVTPTDNFGIYLPSV